MKSRNSARVCGRYKLPVFLPGLFAFLAATGLVVPARLRLTGVSSGLSALSRLLVLTGLVALARLTLALLLLVS
ncbi:MAG: hypothetical protein AAGC76_05200 [Luteibacter sp.]|uniref:hypothetical protein n=1 Tax=Luteibacter sp. TaxID=1886636 RepID=UPI0028092146|nr:hypothetical protein [Luteibacter sp.]MDQ7995234.1 hypothetical protein [Luteibacter sp.]